MTELIRIDHEYDDDGNEVEDSYVVVLNGAPADEYGLSHDYFDSAEDAHSFAEDASEQTGVEITWACMKPAWA